MFGIARLNTLASRASTPVSSGAWAFAAYTSTAEDYGEVVVDSSGNIYNAFTSKGATAIGTIDLIVQKLNSSGVIQWQQHFGSSANTVFFPSITTDGTNLYILTVFLSATVYSNRIVSLLCSDGTVVASRSPYNNATSGGATLNPGRISMMASTIIFSHSGPSSTASSNNYAITRMPTALTTTTWQQRYNTTTLSETTYFTMHLETDGTNIYGAYNNGTNVLVKTDSSGVSLYQKVLSGNYSQIYSSCGTNGVVHVFTTTAQPVRFGQLSNAGAFNYEKSISGFWFPINFTDSSSNCYVAGPVSGNTTTIEIAKLDSSGNFTWRTKLDCASPYSNPFVDRVYVNGSFLYLSIRADHTTRSTDRILFRLPADGSATGTTATVGGAVWNYSTSTNLTLGSVTLAQPTNGTATVIATPAAVTSALLNVTTNTAYSTNEQANLA